jgi:hypothetical protein
MTLGNCQANRRQRLEEAARRLESHTDFIEMEFCSPEHDTPGGFRALKIPQEVCHLRMPGAIAAPYRCSPSDCLILRHICRFDRRCRNVAGMAAG